MEVVAKAVACAADVSDDLALLDRAGGDREARLMGVAGGDAAAVVDAGVVAVAAALGLGLVEDDRSGLGGSNRRPGGNRDVHAGVQASPAHPERRDDRAVHRPDEAAAGGLDGTGRKRCDPAVGECRSGQLLLDLVLDVADVVVELVDVAASHGWSLDGIAVSEFAVEDQLKPESQYTIFHPSEVELIETNRVVLEEVERVAPTRIVFDSLSEMRLLAQGSLRYRRQILALKHFFIGRQCTVLLLDDRTSEVSDLQLHSLAHGVITLAQLAPEYGAERRRLRVTKMRGQEFRGGYHDFRIARGGLVVFPRLRAHERDKAYPPELIRSGIDALDNLWGGGLERGTSTLLVGPSGAGKSSVAMQYALNIARGGESAVIFTFDEGLSTLLARGRGLGFDIDHFVDVGLVTIHQVDPAELSPGEFADTVRRAAVDGCRLVVIDSLNGYLQAMPEEKFLIVQLHEMLTYLGQQGVNTLLVVAQEGIVGANMRSPVDATYLADSVMLFRFFEVAGEVRQAISVVKKRTGWHERSIRPLNMSSAGISVGEPLRQFRGILTGVPVPEPVAPDDGQDDQ